MSREERRQYQRQMKSMERGAALPPAARARAERNAQRRATRRPVVARTPGAFDRRFWTRTMVAVLGIGLIAFSLQWSNGMPEALYAGLAAGGAALLVLVGFRFLQRRTASRS